MITGSDLEELREISDLLDQHACTLGVLREAVWLHDDTVTRPDNQRVYTFEICAETVLLRAVAELLEAHSNLRTMLDRAEIRLEEQDQPAAETQVVS